MRSNARSFVSVLFAACLIFGIVLFAGASDVHAKVDFQDFDEDGFVFSDFNEFEHSFYKEEGAEKAVSFETTNKNVAYAEADQNMFESRVNLIPVGPGTCTITITGSEGGKISFPVTVETKYFKQRLEDYIDISEDIYGSKRMVVETFSVKGVKVSLKVGKKKYKAKKTNSDYKAVFKLAKVYPLNTKYNLTLSYKGITIKRKGKFSSGTWVDEYAKVNKKSPKKVSLSVLNLHKGDVVKVKYKGKTYSSSKFKKNTKFGKTVTVTVKVKKNFKSSSKFRVWVVNKDKKRLCKDVIMELKDWVYAPYEDEDEDLWEDQEDEYQ